MLSCGQRVPIHPLAEGRGLHVTYQLKPAVVGLQRPAHLPAFLRMKDCGCLSPLFFSCNPALAKQLQVLVSEQMLLLNARLLEPTLCFTKSLLLS